MPGKCEQTFEETIRAVGPRNAQTLERKAHIAALLAGTYPEHRDILRALENKALDQVFRILTEIATSRSPSHTTNKRADRDPAGVRVAAD